MATHSSVLAQEIPWTYKPGGLQSIGLQRLGHDSATKQHILREPPLPATRPSDSFSTEMLPARNLSYSGKIGSKS